MGNNAERLRLQLRDTAQKEQKDDSGGDRLEDAASAGIRRGVQGTELLLRQKKNSRNTVQNIPEQFAESGHAAPDAVKDKDSEPFPKK